MLEEIMQITYVSVITASMTITIAGPGLIWDRYSIIRNKILTSGKSRAQVLINDSYDSSFGRILFANRTKIANFLTARDIQADWRYDATSLDFINAIENPKYQSVVLVGHGSPLCWEARDKTVTEEMIKQKHKDTKEGYWLQITCGAAQDFSIAELVMKDKTRIFGYDKEVSVSDILFFPVKEWTRQSGF